MAKHPNVCSHNFHFFLNFYEISTQHQNISCLNEMMTCP